VQDKIIQSLMRHSSLSVTMKHYVKASPEANIKAMQKLSPPESPEHGTNYGTREDK
jgi:integrase